MAKFMEKRASLTSHDHFTIQQKEMPVLDNNNSRWQHCATESPSLPNPKEQKRNDDVNLTCLWNVNKVLSQLHLSLHYKGFNPEELDYYIDSYSEQLFTMVKNEKLTEPLVTRLHHQNDHWTHSPTQQPRSS